MMKINTGIEEGSRQEIAMGLSQLLSETYTLFLKTHNYHWNVMGPMFQSLHLLFESQYQEVFEATDKIAERIKSLGFPVRATFAEFLELSQVKEAVGVPRAKEMIKDLVDSNEIVARTSRTVFPIAEAGNDESTMDLLTERLNAHEKAAWMLRSHLEE